MIAFNIQKKIFLSMMFIILIVILPLLSIINFYVKGEIQRKLRNELEIGRRICIRFQNLNEELLLRKCQAIAEIPQLKATVNIPDVDHQTVLFTAQETQKLAGTKMFVVTDSNGNLLADVENPDKEGDRLTAIPAVKAAINGAEYTGTCEYSGRFYQVAAAPLLYGEQVIGSLLVGEEINDKMALSHREMTGCDVLILSGEKIIAYDDGDFTDRKDTPSLTPDFISRLNAILTASDDSGNGIQSPERRGSDIFRIQIHGHEHLVASTPLTGIKGYYLLALSLDTALLFYKHILLSLFLLGAGIVAIAFFFSHLLSQKISQPLRVLTKATVDISSGNFNTSVPITTNDEIGLLGNSFNKMVRELKQTQAQIIQAGKMAAVGELAAGVAHELNNPIGGILGYAQYTKEKIDKKKDDNPTSEDIKTWSQYLGYIERESQRCKSIVQNLLKFARASRVEFELIDVNAVLGETFVFVEHQLNMNKVKLDKDIEAGLPRILGNANHLQQVFTNIILNGQQSMPDGGQLKVSSRHIVGEDNQPGRVEVEVRDSGCGIPEENLNRIFEPFFTTKKVSEGTGLGLSLSYGIVKDHGGEIKVKSAVGKGTTFIISMPVGGEAGKDENNVNPHKQITGKL